ncbi:hypothetical protein SARC_17597, partial [Sphaeroforma arctica JP610]
NLDATESYDADLAFLQGLKGYDWTFRKPKCRWGKALKLQLWGTLVAVCLFIGLPALCLSLFVVGACSLAAHVYEYWHVRW